MQHRQRPHFALIVASAIIISALLPRTFTEPLPVAKADGDGHSHFRFGHITWENKDGDPANSARITFTAGFRRNAFNCRDPLTGGVLACREADGFPGVGDIFLEIVGATRINNFGDGTSTGTLRDFSAACCARKHICRG